MIRNLKAMGISLVAMFAMSALGASTASAVTTDVVTTGASPAILTGVSHDHVFRLTNSSGGTISKFECTTSKFAATVNNGDPQVTAEVLYEGTLNETPHTMKDCNSSFGEALVTTTGCAYILDGKTSNVHGGGNDGPVWIECDPNKQIIVTNTSPHVTLTIPAQTPTSGGVTYTNVASHNGDSAVRVTATVTGVTFNCHPTFTCTLGGIPHHGNNTDYNGTVTMTAYADSDGLPTPVTEGPRTSLVSS